MSEMDNLLILIQKLNISKVSLASYLGVSRQMVYNYLSKKSLDEWPIDKQIKLLDLFQVNNVVELENMEFDSKKMQDVLMKLNNEKGKSIGESYANLDQQSQMIIHDFIRLCEDPNTKGDVNILLSLLEHSLISEEYKFLIIYLGKTFNKIPPNFFTSAKNKQKAFEGLLFSASCLFNSNKYSEEKIASVHKEFLDSLNNKIELDNQATNVINITKVIAKRELGIDTIDDSNIDKVLEKMFEIQNRTL